MLCLTSCLDYYYYDGLNCVTCNMSAYNCSRCINITYCIDCFVGSFLNESNQCLLCTSRFFNCVACNSMVCINCDTNFYLSNQSVCESCNFFMAGCNSCSNQTYCTSCEPFVFYLDLNSSNCLSCTNVYGSCL